MLSALRTASGPLLGYLLSRSLASENKGLWQGSFFSPHVCWLLGCATHSLSGQRHLPCSCWQLPRPPEESCLTQVQVHTGD